MKPRDRVLTSLSFKKPDRVPIYIGGSASKFYKSTAFKLADHFNICKSDFEMVPAGFKYVPYNDKLWEKLNIDVRYLYPNHHRGNLLKAQETKGDYINKWGGKFSFMDTDGERPNLEAKVPFKKASMEELKNFSWPKPDPKLVSGLREKAEKLYNENRYAIAVYRPLSAGIFGTTRYFLRGTENFFMDMIQNEKFADNLLKKVCETQKKYYKMVLDEIGDLIDIIEIEDDLGAQNNLLISPDLYRKMIKPYHKDLIEFIISKAPNVKILMHSDGAIKDIISDLIEIGVDILNPVQPKAKNMNLKELNKEFGGKIAFAGAVDVQEALASNINDVKDCVKLTIDALATGGGYLLGPSHNFTSNIPVENIIAMVDTAINYGTYN